MHKWLKYLSILQTFSVASSVRSVMIYIYIFVMTHFALEAEYAEYVKISYIVDLSVAIGLFGSNLLMLREPLSYVIEHMRSMFVIMLGMLTITFTIYNVFINPLLPQYMLMGYMLIIMNILYQLIFFVLVKQRRNKAAFYMTFAALIFELLALTLLTKTNQLTCTSVVLARMGQISIYIFVGAYLLRDIIRQLLPTSVDKVKESFRRQATIGTSAIIGVGSQYVDKIIASTLTASALARYSVARFDIPFIGIFMSNMSYVYMEELKRNIVEKYYERNKELLRSFIKYAWFFNVIFFTLLFVNSKLVISLLYSEYYIQSHELLRIFLVNFLLRVLPYSNVIIALGLERIIIRRMLTEIGLQLVVSFVLLHFFGIYGLACSLILVTALWSVPYNFYYIAKTCEATLAEIIPFKTMMLFFVKSFIVCFCVTSLIELYVTVNRWLIFVISICLILGFCYKEIKYILKNTR